MYKLKESMDSSEINVNGYNLGRMHEYFDIYDNGSYELHIRYKSKNKKKIEPEDPNDEAQMLLIFCPHDWDWPAISVSVISNDSDEKDYALIGLPGERTVMLDEMDEEEEEIWELARQAVLDADTLIKELYPNYHIVSNRAGR